MMKLYSTHSHSKGQAVSEFIAVAAVLVPLLLLVASFANLLDVNTTATKASRFYAWEQTIYSTNQGLSSSEINDRIKENMDELLLDIDSKKWSDFATGGERTANNLPSLVDKSLGVAFKSERVGSPTANFIGVHSTSIGRRAGLNADTLMAPSISIPIDANNSLLKIVEVINFRENNYQNHATPYDEIAGQSRFHIEASAPMITDGWVPEDEDSFTEAIVQLSRGGNTLGIFENPLGLGSSVISNLLQFEEMELGRGTDGLGVVSGKQSELLPSDLGDFVE